MRVTIDATSALIRSAGVKNYVYYWFNALCSAARAEGRGDEFRAFPFLGSLGDLDHENSHWNSHQTTLRMVLVQAVNLFGAPVLDWAIRGSDIFHGSNQARCAPRKARLTSTLHDLTVWLMPELHTPANVQADQLYAERVLRKADGLIAVSENTRQDAIRLLGLKPEKITTIHSGVAPAYFDAAPVRRAKPYVLFAGTVEPRKNLNGLLDAWSLLKPELRAEFDLVIAGPRGWESAPTVARIDAEATRLGYVPERDMPGLFAGATVFAYPSFYEGFGFPVAQAMAARVPIVTSNTSSLPEVARDGALLVDPKSPDEIAAAIMRLLESESERKKLAGYGRASAERFRWEKCAAASISFFRRIAGK